MCDRVAEEVRSSWALFNTLSCGIEGEEARGTGCGNHTESLGIIGVEGRSGALLDTDPIGCISIHEGIKRAIANTGLRPIISKIIERALSYTNTSRQISILTQTATPGHAFPYQPIAHLPNTSIASSHTFSGMFISV